MVREQLAVNLVEIHQVVFGILFILIVLIFPGGLVEAWGRLKKVTFRKEKQNVNVSQ